MNFQIYITKIAIIIKNIRTTYFIDLFLGTAAGTIVIFINWLLNRKKVVEIKNIQEMIFETTKLQLLIQLVDTKHTNIKMIIANILEQLWKK